MSHTAATAWEQKENTCRAFVEQMDLFTKPVLRQVAPGKFVPAAPRPVPEIILAQVVDLGNGEYTLKPFREDFLRLNEENLALLGMKKHRHTLLRLAKAGFIECIKPAPHTILLNLTSWYNHLRRVAEVEADGEEFWEEGRGNIELYREVSY